MPRRPIPSRCRRCRGNGNYAVRRSRGFFTPRVPLWLLKRAAPSRHFSLPAFAGEVGTEIFGAMDFLVHSDSPALRFRASSPERSLIRGSGVSPGWGFVWGFSCQKDNSNSTLNEDESEDDERDF